LRKQGITTPLIGDFHYIGHKLLAEYPACAEALDKYRINPGNVGFKNKRDSQFTDIVEIAIKNNKAVRIGANWGSLDQELLTKLMEENAASPNPVDARAVTREAMVSVTILLPRLACLGYDVGDLQDLGQVLVDHGRIIAAGVARDGKYCSLGEPPHPYVYQPVMQSYDPKMTLVVRTTVEPQALAPAVREQIRVLDAKLPVADVKTLRDQLDLSLFPSRVAAWTLGGFGVLALLLAAVGIYGVVSYSVAQRTREIGVRMALGGKEKDVLRLVLGQGLFVIAVGLAVGLSLAFAVTRLLAGFLYGVEATDLLTFGGVTLLLAIVALGASYIPARRATKVDPLVALRYE